MKYAEYFLPEIKNFIDPNRYKIISKEMNINYDENREIGENENYICKLIQDDIIEEFIIYTNKKNISINSKIKQSIFETNNFLLKNEPSLIEYAAFYGSIQIFKYLNLNDASLNPKLWLYVIHSNNAELIHFLEELHVDMGNYSYDDLIKEAIKCHHNEIKTYFQNQYLQANIDDYNFCFQYYNFIFPHNFKINDSHFYYLCKYNYHYLVKLLIKYEDIDINTPYTYHKDQICCFYYDKISFYYK